MTNRELREKRAKLIADAQVILRNVKHTSEDVTNANKMLDDADVIKSEYEAVERGAAMDEEIRSTRPISQPIPGAIDTPESRKAAETEAFRNYIVSGKVSTENIRNLRSYNKTTASVVEHRDMNGDTGVDGGYLVPVGYNPEIESAKLAYGQLLTVVRDWRTNSGQPIQWPLSDDVSSVSTEMTDGTDVAELDIPLGQVTFNVSTFRRA
jgi:HK97 family phage major capsid protein